MPKTTHIICALKDGGSPHDVAELQLMTAKAYAAAVPGHAPLVLPEAGQPSKDVKNVALFLREHLSEATLNAVLTELSERPAADAMWSAARVPTSPSVGLSLGLNQFEGVPDHIAEKVNGTDPATCSREAFSELILASADYPKLQYFLMGILQQRILQSVVAESTYEFVITGRIPGDDDDTTLIVRAGSFGEAKAEFEEEMYGASMRGNQSVGSVLKKYGDTVFITNAMYSIPRNRSGGGLKDANRAPEGFVGEWSDYLTFGGVRSALEKAGFSAGTTGGGCMAMVSPTREDGLYLMLTDDGGMSDIFHSREPILFGVYSEATGDQVGECLEGTYMSLQAEIMKFAKDAPVAELPEAIQAARITPPVPKG